MKGIIIVRDFIIFLSELGILLLSILFITTAGAAMGEFVFNFDSRLASETLFGFHTAADMAPSYEASFIMASNPYTMKISKDGNDNFIFINSTRELFNLAHTAQVKILPPRKLFLVNSGPNEIILIEKKMDEKHNWLIGVKKTDGKTVTLVNEQEVK
ncbi:MAG: hypothetical protein HYT71_01435 [Candidatus Aenigmarchaeota archaeon]|nr:hypothetical protein [Candidatus Aenigmarchaeota archaeon]